MAKQKLTFRKIPADALIRRYRNTQLIFLGIHLLTLLVAVGILTAAFLQKMTWTNSIFSIITIGVVNWLIHTVSRVQLSKFNAILTNDCDPVKLEQVFAPFCRNKGKLDDATLNLLRGQFYQGKWQEAQAGLEKCARPSPKSHQFFQYYNLLACCADQAGDLDKLLAIQQKIQRTMGQLKANSPQASAGHQLLAILEVMITFHMGQYTRCKEACKELYDQASFALSRINISYRLAQLEHMTGANHSAANRCEYIIDDGGTTFYATEARSLYVTCCGKEYEPDGYHPAPESLEPDEDWEEEMEDTDSDNDADTDTTDDD